MRFIHVVIKNLRTRSTRTWMTVAALAIAVMAVTTLWNIAWGYAASASSFYSARGTDIVVVRAGVSNRLTSSLRYDLLARLRQVAGVASVDGSLTEMVSLGDANLIGIPLRGVTLDGATIEELTIQSGRTLEAGDYDSEADDGGDNKAGEVDAVMLGGSLAEALKKRDGQQVEIEGTEFRVVGVFQATNPFDSNSVVAPLAVVQKLMERPDVVSEIQVRVAEEARNEAGLEEVCAAIEALGDEQDQPLGLKAQRTAEFVHSATEASLGRGMAWATSAIVLTLSMVGMLNTMLMSVLERTRELGILRAVGWKRSRVIRMIVSESVVISLVAAGLGLIAAWGLMKLLASWSTTSLLVPHGLSQAAVVIGVLAALAAGVLGSVYPACYASGITPADALRHD